MHIHVWNLPLCKLYNCFDLYLSHNSAVNPDVPGATFLNNALPPTSVNAPTVVCPIQPTGEGAQLERRQPKS